MVMIGIDPGIAFIEKREAIPSMAARPFLAEKIGSKYSW